MAMVEMAATVVRTVKLPVTVKTRIGYGTESDMPIVELAKGPRMSKSIEIPLRPK